jgi:hypothetical protein
MLFVYLDEFGHIGPFVSRADPRYHDHPAFGLAGIILPEPAVRPFATAFLQLKQHVFAADITRAGVIAQKWEKKGTDIFRPKAIARYPELRACGFRLINLIRKHGGYIFYYGIEKVIGKLDGNPTGLYTTAFGNAIRRLDEMCIREQHNFALVVDEHSARPELLKCAEKTMYGHEPARRLISPPFEVESYLNQNIQAADWVAAIVGRLWSNELRSDQYVDHADFRKYYWDRLHQVATCSVVYRRRPPRPKAGLRVTVETETAFAIALRQATLKSR